MNLTRISDSGETLNGNYCAAYAVGDALVTSWGNGFTHSRGLVRGVFLSASLGSKGLFLARVFLSTSQDWFDEIVRGTTVAAHQVLLMDPDKRTLAHLPVRSACVGQWG